LNDLIFVADYGQPDRTEGGLTIPDSAKDYWRYRFGDWRFGEVIAIGPGRHSRMTGKFVPMPIGVSLGDVVMFSRKHGTRLPGEMRFEHEKHGSLLMRVIDPMKAQAVMSPGFEPWWSVKSAQNDPREHFSG
jgi:co-chaperonin GroES (HSP10)